MTLRDLVREALRMRPDRLIVGECRGPEVIDLLMALNTGHDGCCRFSVAVSVSQDQFHEVFQFLIRHFSLARLVMSRRGAVAR